MKIADLHRVRQLNEDRKVLRERIENLQRFVADDKKAKEGHRKSSSKKADSDDELEALPDHRDAKIEISARYQNQSSRVSALLEPFDEDWLEAAEVIIGRRIDKIEAEMRELGVTL